MNMGAVYFHLFDNRGEFVKKFLISIQGEQVFFSKKEAQAVSLCPTQAMTRWCSHGCDGVLDVNHGVQLPWEQTTANGETFKADWDKCVQ